MIEKVKKQQSMRIFKSASFVKFTRKERISDKKLIDAIEDILRGQIDASLGSHVIKQRIARPGHGKSGGYRAIILFRHKDKAFFQHGFAKKDKGNLTAAEEEKFKGMAKHVLAMTEESLEKALENRIYTEIFIDEKASKH